MPETFRNEYLREGAGANGGIARNGISTPRVCQGKIPRNPAPIGHLHAGEDDCWRNQAITQACAFYSPFCASVSEIAMFRQLRSSHFCLTALFWLTVLSGGDTFSRQVRYYLPPILPALLVSSGS